MVVWILVIIVSVALYIIYHKSITPETISAFLKKAQDYVIVSYFIISMVRGFTLLPNTPLVLAGTLLFPEKLLMVFLISMFGILFSSAMIYYFSEYMGFDNFFETKYPGKIKSIRNKLNGKAGVFFVVVWSFFPLVPTDAVCYVAGSVRMNIIKFLIAVFAGELVLVSFYIWVGKKITTLF